MFASWRLNQYSRRLCEKKSEMQNPLITGLEPGPLVREADAIYLHHCLYFRSSALLPSRVYVINLSVVVGVVNQRSMYCVNPVLIYN